jgi:hypothetical protein
MGVFSQTVFSQTRVGWPRFHAMMQALLLLPLLCSIAAAAQVFPTIQPQTGAAPQNVATDVKPGPPPQPAKTGLPPQQTKTGLVGGDAGPANSLLLPETDHPSISLSPAVVMARGSFGQGLTQTLTLSNQTSAEFVFDLVAEDVLVKNGERVFIPAGETPRSVAATAVFSQKTIVVQPFTSASVDVRLTIPPETDVRAMVALFRGTNRFQTSSSAVGVTASLGALLTFNLTDNLKLDPQTIQVKPATASSNMVVSQWIRNTGTEPALLEGTAVVLNASGILVGRMAFQPQRLLPGERLEFAAEYAEQLPSGGYRTLCSFQFEGKTLTTDAAFQVP